MASAQHVKVNQASLLYSRLNGCCVRGTTDGETNKWQVFSKHGEPSHVSAEMDETGVSRMKVTMSYNMYVVE